MDIDTQAETTTPAEIRCFELADYPAARALWEATPGVGLSDADNPEAIAKFLARNPGLSFVAHCAGVLVGTILCGHDGRRGLIHHLVAKPNVRRRGLGRELVHRGLAALRKQGVDKCHLLVFQTNEPALAFWRTVAATERTELAVFSLPTAVVASPDSQSSSR